jgi:hypothetical protein
MCDYSIIEGCIRQSSDLPMKTEDHNITTQKISFNVPQNGGYNYRFNECVDQIAQLIDRYFDTHVEDLERINNLVDQEVVDAMRRQEKQNELENINGGSR